MKLTHEVPAELPILELPTDRPRPAVPSFRSVRERVEIPPAVAAALDAMAQRAGTNLSTALLAAFLTLLQRVTGQDDLAAGLPDGLILRVDLSGDPSFAAALGRTREADVSSTGLVQVRFSFQEKSLEDGRETPEGTCETDLCLHMTHHGKGLTATAEYATDLFEASTVRRLLGHLRLLLEGIAADPASRISDLPLLTAGEREQVLNAWNPHLEAPEGPENDPGPPVHELFEAWARETPGALAVDAEGRRLTYAELNDRADRLARRLRRMGAGPETVVALRLERSPELVVATVAALKAGAAWLPVDPAHPAERLAYVLRDSGAALLVTVDRHALPDLPVATLLMDGDEGIEEAGTDLAPWLGPEQLSYVIYTSGSTGTPKGSGLTHRNLSTFTAWDREYFSRGPADRCTLLAGPGFDASVWDIWSALTSGASLHVPPARVVLSPPALLDWMAERGITVSFLPTPLAEAVLAEPMPAGLALRFLPAGGERLRRRPAPGVPFHLINIYGPTECTVVATASRVAAAGDRPPELGPPIANTRIYVLDRDLRPAPVGVPGELCITGDGMGRGYLGRPEMTAERFVPNPFDAPGSRLYRSGDLGRWLPQGELEFIGRIDHQVKIRGFRIELGEIEAVLGRHPAVRLAAVMVRAGEARLTAYLTLRGPAEDGTREALAAYLAGLLPEYMVPTAWVFLDELPFTPNGKVDRRALARIEPELESPAAAPRTPLEELLAGLFAQVLGLNRTLGVHDDFFELGGHSLLAAKLTARVREACGVEIDLGAVFESPTVAGLAARLQEESRQRLAAPPLVPVPRDGALPLSFAQRRLWFLDRLQPGTALYNLPFAYDLRGELEMPALRTALDGVVRRHEALRTVFAPGEDGEPAQAALPGTGPFPLPEVNLADLPDEARRAEAERLTADEARRPYDLARGPLMRAALLRLGDGEHRLLLGMHHIVSDGWSMGVLMDEVSALYRAAPLAPLVIQYPDFAVWQRRWLAGGILDEQLAWWRDRLAGAPAVLELAGDRPRPAVPSFRGAVERLPLGSDLAAGLAGLSRRGGATLFMTLLAAFQALLHRYTGQDDLVVGSPAAGRDRPELEGLIGFFVNMLPLRAGLAGEPDFLALLAGVRETAMGAYAHQDLPFDKLVEELAPGRNLAAAPIFQAVLALQEAPAGPDLGPGVAAVAAAELETGTAKFDLSLLVERGPGGLEAIAEYAADLFDGETVRRLLGHFRVLLEGVVADPGARVSELPLLTPGEREQVAADTFLEVPEAPVHVLFERWADRTPAALAIVHGDERLTYAELDRRANALAHRLRGLGVGPESLVAVLLERSADLVVAALGTLKAGGAWLPIDPAHPAERVLYTLRDSGAAVLLTDTELPEAPLPPERILLLGRVRCAHQDSPRCAQRTLRDEESGERPEPAAADPDLLAYVIYTSGSTGAPKGTELRHGGLSSLVAWHLRTYGLGPGDRSPLLAGPGFDASVWEMWPPLAAGAALLVPPREVVLSPPALLGWLAEEAVTVAFLPTPLAEAVLAEPIPDGLVLRALLTGGDRLHRRPAPGLPFALVNHYGPTESTVVATAGTVGPTGAGLPDIGSEIANTRVHLLDRGLRPVPLGVPGELCLAGEGLARGYRGRPDLTAERFVPAPDGGRLYRTGDLARRLPDGNLEFLGRIDQQVKIRGFRIELGEVESALAALPGVAAAAALVREERLTAYLVAPAVLETINAEDLRAALARRLPEPMIPAAWVFLDEMPLTPNGKVDRRALERIAPPETEAPAATAQSPLQELVAGLFAEVLGIERGVGPEDDFFHLGGHSLLAVQLVSRARQAFGVELDVRAVFERPTVAGLAGRVEAAARGGVSAPPVLPAERGAEAPLSFAQQRLWFLDRFEAGGTALYNVPVVFRIQGPGLSVAALAGALDEVVRRHEALRSVFREGADGEPVQTVQPAAPIPLPVVDLAGLSDAKAEVERIETERAALPFDLARGPLLRALLLRLGSAEHRLMVSTHHIASDGWSIEVLVREVSAIYQARLLPPLPIQYADYALWQRRWLSGAALEAEVAGWRERLAGLPAALELPTDRTRPAAQSFRGAVRRAAVPPELAAGLAALSRRRGATFFMTAMAAFQALLHRWTGQEDFAVGTPVAGRGRGETEGLIGFFVNTLALRASVAGDPGFGELLARVRAAALEAYAHQDVPFERLVAELVPQRDLSRTPLFQVVLSLHEVPAHGLDLGPGFTATMSEIRTATSKFDLSLELSREDDGLAAGFEYAADLFDAATADRFLGHLRTLLAGIVAMPEARVSDLPLLPEEERRQLALWDAEGQRVHPQGGLLHGLFETQAARTPEVPALVWGREVLSYAELEARSARLARRLRRLGVGPEVPVGICLPRTPDLVVSLMAVLRAGGFYVPLDPVYPAERLAYLLEDSGCRLVLTDRSVEKALPPTSARLLHLDDAEEDGAVEEPGVVPEILPGNLAYLIYTSGSTGRPKAVAIEHRSAVLLAHWAREVFSPEEFAGMLASTSITFDMSVFEIFVTLAWGGTLILVDNALALAALKAPGALPAGIEVRLLDTVPSAAAELLRMDGLPSSVRTINLGGEAVPRALADRAYQRPETERLFNLYGPSEDTTFSTISLIERDIKRDTERDSDRVLVGRPVDGTRAWVLDRGLRLAPIGVPGELYLAGGGLSRGYLGRPELTAERFLPDPFGEVGGRMYQTGDLVRRRPDGELDYLGRLDHQVKIRGFRVELGEVEAALAAIPGVEEAVLVAREDTPGDRRLVAYVAAPTGEVTPVGLRQALQSRLPDYMVPAAFVLLGDLPRTPNGKVDRKALPAPEATRTADDDFVAPSTPVEQALANLWSPMLGVEEIGVHDDFFGLGGHSILAMRIASRVRDLFEVEIPVRTLFERPTIAELAATIEDLLRERSGKAEPERVSLTAPEDATNDIAVPLSYAQQRLWFLDRLQPGSAVYNLPLTLRIEGPLEAGVLAAALSEVVRRHAALRTTFAPGHGEAGGEPLQVVAAPSFHSLPQADLSGLPAERREAEAGRLLAAEQRRPFDLERGPLLRSLLVRLEAGDHRLILALHHIIADGWSLGVLLRELEALYGAAAQGRPSPLAELPAQYADFAVWQRRWLAAGELESQLGWWLQRLAGSPPALDLPADHPRPAVPSLRGGTERLALAPELSAAVERLGQLQGTTPFMTLLAVFAALLYRYTGQEDLWVGTPVANRSRTELEGLIGMFVNTLVLRTRLDGEPAFAEALDRVRETVLSAYAHQDVPFEKLVERLAPTRDLSRSPLFQVSFSAEGEAVRTTLAPGVTLEPLPAETGTAKFDLLLGFWKTLDGTLTATIEHSLDLFEPATVRRMLGHLAALLAGAVAAPETRISDLPLFPEEERRQLALWDVEGQRVHPEGGLLHGLFEAQAARTPAAPVLAWKGEVLTYAELEARSAGLARRLRRLGVGPEVPVGICLPRTPDLVVALMAVLRAGGFYVPLDPVYPTERLAYLLEDSGCRLVLTDRSVEKALPPTPARRLHLDGAEEDGAVEEPGVVPEILPGNLAYLIYTSGSTGRPKAVAIEHRSAVLLAHWAREVFSPEEFAGVLASTSITFDMSVFEIFVTLAWGGTLILVDNALALASLKAPDALPAGIEVRLLDTVPSAAAELLRMDGLPASVRTINLGGEAVPRSLADRAYQRPETERLYNLYGPSEDTTFSTLSLIKRDTERGSDRVLIGRPVDGTRAWVLDHRLLLAPIGVPGELYLAGGGLSRGYLGRPELTAERFLPDPCGEPGTRMYRTGDLVRRRSDGELDYLGRLDHQVKIRGFRVELGEVEAALAACPGVEEAVLVAREDTPGDRRLVAYLVAPAGEARPTALRQALQGRLPDYMVPAAFVLLADLPRTPNGKVDRKALPVPEATRAADDEVFTAPSNPIEEALAKLWRQVLGVEEIGVHDSFFGLGGHSLLAMRIVSRMRDLFGVELSVQTLFERPTIAELAEEIAVSLLEQDGSTEPPETSSENAPENAPEEAGPAPLSYAQQRLWFLDRLQPDSAVYNLPLALRIDGALAAGTLAAALSDVVRRHAALRTTFTLNAGSGEPEQIVAAAAPHPLPRVDLGGLPAERREAEAGRLFEAEQRRPFDLERGPLLRSLLVRLGAGDHRLLLAMHHIVADGWSLGVLVRELEALYGAFSQGRPSPLPELPVQYAGFAVWQRRWLAAGELEAQLGWWRQRLAGSPPELELPADHPRPPVASLRGGTEGLTLTPELSAAAQQFGRRQGTTLFMTMLASFEALLHRYTGQDDLWVGTPVANRNRTELEGLIGMFVNTLVLRTRLDGELAFAEALDRVRETVLSAYARQDVPFEKLVEELAPARDLSRSPLFEVSFSAEGEPAARLRLAPGVTLTPLPVETGTAKLDLSLAFWKAPGGALEAAAEFTLDRFEPATVRRMLGHLAVLLAGALQDPEARLGDLPLLTAEESLQLQAAWSGGDPLPASASTLHGLFELQARWRPGALALVHGSERLTYGELDARTERLARRLAALGVRPETRVALSAGRGNELAVGFLGILRAGGVCVPLDPDHPAERLAFVLEDADAVAVVTTAAIAPRLPATDLPRVLVDAPETEEPANVPLIPALAENLAYVIYTSGSTGRPKGVAVPHRAAAAHCGAVIQLYGLAAADRVPQLASPAFDVAVEEIFATLAAGAALVMRGDEPWGIGELAEKFDELELTVVNLPTAAWQHWVGELGPLAAPPPLLRLLIIGGEEALAETARQWLRTPFSAVRLLNGYGPTEAVITPTLYEVGSGNSGRGASVPIGRSLPGRSARVLDRRSAAMPAGVPGELCLGGGLARGYLGQPALTAERFIPDPFGEPGARLYRTGDLVRLLPGGDLEFLGRIDQQVKVRGFRIELAEIEAALAAHPGVTAAAVLVQDTAGDRRLVAYAATRADQEVTPAALRQALQGRLPDYMVPAVYVLLDSLPCTPNGKVDRRALPAPEPMRGVDDEIVAPRTAVEEQVAEVWRAVLGIDRVGVYDSFWELGGHSLLATKVLSRLSETFGVHLPLKTLFVNPRLGELAEAVGRAVLADEGDDGESLLSELEGLSEEEIRELLAAEAEEEALEER